MRWRLFGAAVIGIVLGSFLLGFHRSQSVRIAVIPRTSGTALWEPERQGAQAAASALGLSVYWNASTREDDIDGQIALVDRIASGNYKGLVLAPDHSLALITPVRRALEEHLVTVIVGSPLPIPPDQNLLYILNDEEQGARIAAQRIAEITHGRGLVAIIGINPGIAGIVTRATVLEQILTTEFPHIHLVVRREGTFNVAQEQESAKEMLNETHNLDAIVALTSASSRGAISAIEGTSNQHHIKVIEFDPDSLLFDNPILDSVIIEDTGRMGDLAIRSVDAKLHGEPVAALVKLKPVLVTRDNVDSPRIRNMTAMDWRAGTFHQQWSPQQ